MKYGMKDKRELSGDEHTIYELRIIRDSVSRYYEKSIVVFGLGDNYELEMLENRLIDVCYSGVVGDFRFEVEDWKIIRKLGYAN